MSRWTDAEAARLARALPPEPGEAATYEQCALALGVTRSRVMQIEKAALRKLGKILKEEP